MGPDQGMLLHCVWTRGGQRVRCVEAGTDGLVRYKRPERVVGAAGQVGSVQGVQAETGCGTRCGWWGMGKGSLRG